uniref:ABI family, member 3 (NESH) binding protein b n=1 Tax=Echeneis naucrates TaxID=173247 RepID=A0A665U667_ECHNA
MSVRRQNMKVRINATGDTIVMKFVHPSPDVKLEGYILGYGSSLFSKQFIQLPENGQPYETEMDAEPKYLVAVQPIPVNDVKKHCTGKVNLEKPLQLVIGSVSPTAVLLSWGNFLKTPYEGNIMNECLEDGYYTIRYRERNRKWIYQTCPTSDTVIDNLKPNTPYEFGVRPNKDDRSGTWSKPVIHNTNMSNKNTQKPYKTRNPLAKPMVSNQVLWVRSDLILQGLASSEPAVETLLIKANSCVLDASLLSAPDQGNTVKNDTTQPTDPPPALPRHLPTKAPSASTTAHPLTKLPFRGGSLQGQTTKAPTNAPEKPHNPAGNLYLTTSLFKFPVCDHPGFSGKSSECFTEWSGGFCDVCHLSAPRQETWEDSDLFKSQPTSDVDAMGKKRYVAPHVIYQTGKKPEEPCSITSSLNYFPEDEPGEANVTAPPKNAPSNLTVVTVEGCPSFIILDWEKTDNDTTEYEVISTAKGPDGEQVSILTTNQTHTAVENLKPESSYEFKVKPKNEMGAGPPSEPVSFNTESADPRVSENVSGKDAIWTQFPFKTDSYSDCHGKQYVKRTWYRKFVGVQLCNSLRYKIYLSDSLNGKFYNIGDQSGFGEDHCQFVDSFLDGRTGRQLRADHLPSRPGFYRAVRQEPVHFGLIGGHSHVNYVSWYECGTPIPGKW